MERATLIEMRREQGTSTLDGVIVRKVLFVFDRPIPFHVFGVEIDLEQGTIWGTLSLTVPASVEVQGELGRAKIQAQVLTSALAVHAPAVGVDYLHGAVVLRTPADPRFTAFHKFMLPVGLLTAGMAHPVSQCAIYETRSDYCATYPTKPDAWMTFARCTYTFDPVTGERSGECSPEVCGGRACCTCPRLDGEPEAHFLGFEDGGLACKHLRWVEGVEHAEAPAFAEAGTLVDRLIEGLQGAEE